MANDLRPGANPERRDSAIHVYEVGQAVRLKGGPGRPFKSAEIYRITGTLPPSGDSPQYRIRSDEERHERVAAQHSLEPVGMSASDEGASLIERTFGGFQRTKGQQPKGHEPAAKSNGTVGSEGAPDDGTKRAPRAPRRKAKTRDASAPLEGVPLRVVIEFFRTRVSDEAHAIIGRETTDASDLDHAIEIARQLSSTLDMPQRPDGMIIRDSDGNELHSSRFTSAEADAKPPV